MDTCCCAAAMISRRASEPLVSAVPSLTNNLELGSPRWYCGTGKRSALLISNVECMSAAEYGPSMTQSTSWWISSPSTLQARISIWSLRLAGIFSSAGLIVLSSKFFKRFSASSSRKLCSPVLIVCIVATGTVLVLSPLHTNLG